MSTKYTPHEKKIWQAGFFNGLRTAKNKYGVSLIEPQLVEARNNMLTYIDATRFNYVKHLDKMYKKSSKSDKYQDELDMDRLVLQFLDFCQSVGIDAFIDYLKDSVYFEQRMYSEKSMKGEEDGN